MTETFTKMELCARDGIQTDAASRDRLLTLLRDADWRVGYAAAIALGDRREAQAVASLLAVLNTEDAAPLYTQKEDLSSTPAGQPSVEWHVPADIPAETLEAWRRRGRLKQAVCLALGEIGIADPVVLARLHRYVTTAAEDYLVRAAAAHALGQLGSADSLPFLRAAMEDEEWCTRTEATKAVRDME